MAKAKKAIAEKTEEIVENEAVEPVVLIEEKVVLEEKAPQVIVMQPAAKGDKAKIEGLTFGDRLLSYVKNCGGETEINSFIKLEFKTLADMQETSKQIKGVLSKLVSENKIVVKEDFSKLGKFFYSDGKTETQYHTAANTKLTVALV